MEIIYIDCKKPENMEEFYDLISKKMGMPDYFGRNLDALNDILDEISNDVLITFYGFDNFIAKAGEKAATAKMIFQKKRDEKQNIRVLFES